MTRRIGVALLLVTFILLLTGPLRLSALTLEEVHSLNPEFAALEFLHTLPPLTLQTAEDGGEIVIIRAVYFVHRDSHWQPWFDQPEGVPDRLLGHGQIYSQKISLTVPNGVSEGSLTEFGSRLPLNFYELRSINPALEYYERLPTALNPALDIAFYAPRGSGLAFIADGAGDIYSLMHIIVRETPARKWEADQLKGRVYHPELGNIDYYHVSLREAEGRFDLTGWFTEQRLAELKTAPGDRLDGDLVVRGVSVSPGFMAGMLNIEVEIHNDSDRGYSMPAFSVTIYDRRGEALGDGFLIARSGIDPGETVTLEGMAILERMADPDDVIYAVEYRPFF